MLGWAPGWESSPANELAAMAYAERIFAGEIRAEEIRRDPEYVGKAIICKEGAMFGVTIIGPPEELIQKLQWRIESNYDDEFVLLTLSEISEQIRNLGFEGVIYVWEERSCVGMIYQFGNHGEYWELHGKTNGYG